MNIKGANGKTGVTRWRRWGKLWLWQNKHNSSPSISSPTLSWIWTIHLLMGTPLRSTLWNTRWQRDLWICRSLRKRKWFGNVSTLLLSNAEESPCRMLRLSWAHCHKPTQVNTSQVCTALDLSALFRWASRLSRTLGNSWGCLLTAFT